jgi:hypothetical protein
MADQTLAGPERCAFSIGARASRMQPPRRTRVHPDCSGRCLRAHCPKMLHKTSPVNRLTLALAAASIALALGGPGCMHSDNDEMTNAVVSGEKSVSMEGNESFFGGKVAVKVTLSRGIGRGLHKAAGKDKGDYTYQKYADNSSKSLLGSPLPPVTLHLILTNRGLDSVTITMVDFVSDMGNFAVDPDTLTIGPGLTAEPTPMVSELGVSSDSMPFKVTLKYGATRETKTFPVSIVHDDGVPAPAAK